MTTALMLAAVEGDSLVRNLFVLLIILICCGAIYYVGRIFISKAGKPLPLMVWDGLFLLIGLIFVLDFLLGLVGRGFINW